MQEISFKAWGSKDKKKPMTVVTIDLFQNIIDGIKNNEWKNDLMDGRFIPMNSDKHFDRVDPPGIPIKEILNGTN